MAFFSKSDAPSSSSSTWSLGTALTAALGASACCTIPLALVSFGIGGVWIGTLTALAPYRWIFITVAVAALGYAGYNEWQLTRRPDCNCDTMFSSTIRAVLLGGATLVVLGLIVSPWLIAPSPSVATQQARTTLRSNDSGAMSNAPTEPASYRQIVLEVEGMTCETCPVTVRKALERVDGVYSAEATLEPPQATVRFDPSTVSGKKLTTATQNAGFPSTPKSDS